MSTVTLFQLVITKLSLTLMVVIISFWAAHVVFAQNMLFSVGERVQLMMNSAVRAEPGPQSSSIGSQTVNRPGTIIAGPVVNGGSVWWEIDFATGNDGWVTDNWLAATTGTGPNRLQRSFYSLPSQQSASVDRGDRNELIAKVTVPAARFERRLQKVTIFAAIDSRNFIAHPASDFQAVSLWRSNGQVWSRSVGTEGQWTRVSTPTSDNLVRYTTTLYTGNLVIPANTAYNFEIKADIKSSAGGNNLWRIGVPNSGVVVSSPISGSVSHGHPSNTVLVRINPVEPPYDVIIVAGQSNAVGFNRPSTDSYTEESKYLRASNRVFQVGRYSTRVNRIVPAKEPLDHWSLIEGGKGFAVPFALRYAVENPNRRVVIIPAARGGVTIRLWDKQVEKFTWVNKSDSTELYDDLLSRVAIPFKQNSDSKVVAVLWQQGEADVNVLTENNPTRYPFAAEGISGYKRELQELRANLRRDLVTPCLPFLAGEMPRAWMAVAPTSRGFQQKQAITEATRSVMQSDPCEKSAFVSSEGAVSNPGVSMNDPVAVDGGAVHFSAAGQYTLGKAYFNAFEGLSQ